VLELQPQERIPPDSGIKRVLLWCGRCGWEIYDVRQDQPPWSEYPIESVSERYRCPNCSDLVSGHWSGGGTTPGTESYRPRSA
jgi:DNA-directed RNA polymerase subunit RPC12/RpoP